MFKKFKTSLNNMKLRNKLITIYLVIGIIPMVLIILVSTNLMTGILREKERQNIQTYLNQAAYSVDSELMEYNNLSDYISFNDAVAQVFIADYENSYDLYSQIVSVIKPQLETVTYFGDSAVQATIYANIDGIKYDNLIIPLDEIKEEFWYSQAYNDVSRQWYVDREKNVVFCVRRMAMLKKQDEVGIFYVSVDYDKLFEALSNDIGMNCGLFITDSNGEVVYNLANFEDKYANSELTYEGLINVDDDSEYTVFYEDLEQTSWRLWLYKPNETIVSDTQPIQTLVYIVIGIGIVTLILGLVWVSKFITSRISYLKKGMKAAEEGDFNVRLEAEEKDEIGELIRGYNTLLGKTQTLITEVYESKITQKKHEMKALQNQINPHFLYNSLSLINWKALENGSRDISDITLALSNFYRTSLNKGRNTLSVSDEISNVKSYIAIQLVMHDNEFDVEYDIAEEILHYEMLNLILQPIVENAIEHGIDLKQDDERGKIVIKGWREEDKIYISVSDNGVGMDEEKAKAIITQKSKGYGIRNVNERIQLYYGEEYCLDVKSKPGDGTCITVCVPIREMKV